MATDPVAWLVAVTFAFGIEAPVGSTTAPVMAPCSTWARQTNALVAKSNDAISNALFRDILAPLRTANATRDCPIQQYLDLDLVADLGRRPFVIGRSDDAPLRARAVADGDTAVACGLGPIFQMQIELTEIAAPGVKPRLRIHPALELLWSRQRATRS